MTRTASASVLGGCLAAALALACSSPSSEPATAPGGGAAAQGGSGSGASGGGAGSGGTAGASSGSGGTTAGAGGTISQGGAGSGGETSGTGGGAGSGGGVSGSGGSSGSSGSGGSGGGGLSNCSQSGLPFCDDFEAHADGSAPQAPFSVEGEVTVSSERFVSGGKSIHVHVGADGGADTSYLILQDPAFPVASNEYYGRMMLWIDSLSGADGHWTLLKSTGTVQSLGETGEYTYGSMGDNVIANYDTYQSAPDCWSDSQDLWPVAQWACVEWHFKGATNELELWVDGSQPGDTHVVGAGQGCSNDSTGGQWLAPTFADVRIGWEDFFGNSGARDFWIDDLAIAAERIGCPAP